MRYNYWTENTCSQMISFDLEGDVVTNIKYMGGCDGNLQSIERILDGWTVEEIEQKLGDIKCGRRPTSCSGQLAIAVRKAYDGLLEPEEDKRQLKYEMTNTMRSNLKIRYVFHVCLCERNRQKIQTFSMNWI